MKKGEIVLILDNIRSSHNVGSIFRTADGAGVVKIFLCGYTPCPTDKFDRPNKEIAKTALGAEKIIPWQYAATTLEAVQKLKKDGYQIIALEQAESSIDYREVKLKDKSAIILGEETKGIVPEVLVECDIVAEIPMLGQKESLNVSVATGIMLFSLTSGS